MRDFEISLDLNLGNQYRRTFFIACDKCMRAALVCGGYCYYYYYCKTGAKTVEQRVIRLLRLKSAFTVHSKTSVVFNIEVPKST